MRSSGRSWPPRPAGRRFPASSTSTSPSRAARSTSRAGHLHGEPLYTVKVSSGVAPHDGTVVADGLVIAFDAGTGAPVAFLLDNGFITDARTGAAGGVAARHLAPSNVDVVAVIGTGAQARYQLDALACVRGFGEVRSCGAAPPTTPRLRGRAGEPRRVAGGVHVRGRALCAAGGRGRRRGDHMHGEPRAAGPSGVA